MRNREWDCVPGSIMIMPRGSGGWGFNWLMYKIRYDFCVLREVNVLKSHLSLERRKKLIAVRCYRPIEIGVIMNCVPITTDCISFWDRSVHIQQLCLQQQSCCWIWTPRRMLGKLAKALPECNNQFNRVLTFKNKSFLTFTNLKSDRPWTSCMQFKLEVKPDIKESNSSFWRHILEVTSDVRSALCQKKVTGNLAGKGVRSKQHGLFTMVLLNLFLRKNLWILVSFLVSVFLFLTQRKWVTDIVKELLARKEIISNLFISGSYL